MQFIDKRFITGRAASTGHLMRIRDSFGSTRDRRYDRRSVKRAEARGCRNHIAAELANMNN